MYPKPSNDGISKSRWNLLFAIAIGGSISTHLFQNVLGPCRSDIRQAIRKSGFLCVLTDVDRGTKDLRSAAQETKSMQ